MRMAATAATTGASDNDRRHRGTLARCAATDATPRQKAKDRPDQCHATGQGCDSRVRTINGVPIDLGIRQDSRLGRCDRY
jgi:hypothetical protein